MSIIIKSGNSADTVDTDGVGNFQVNIKAPVDAASNVLVSAEGRKATYRGIVVGLSSIGGNNALLVGSSTKKVKVTYLCVTVTQTAASSTNEITLSIVNGISGGTTGGTTTTGPLDSNDAAATAVLHGYTVAPTANVLTKVGVKRFLTPSSTSTPADGALMAVEWHFGTGVGSKAVILNDATQGFVVNFFGSGTFYDLEMEWTEE